MMCDPSTRKTAHEKQRKTKNTNAQKSANALVRCPGKLSCMDRGQA